MYENVPSAERQQVLVALERLQNRLLQREEWTHSDTLGRLSQTLQSPLFGSILTLQHSLRQLQTQGSFSVPKKGQLTHGAADPAGSLATPTPSTASSVRTNGCAPPLQQAPPPADLQNWIHSAAKGRQTQTVRLARPGSGGLGFSVVGLSPGGGSSQGIFIRHIQPGGAAHRDGRLQEQDQILLINGSPVGPGTSQQQVLELLQQPGGAVDLMVARDRPPDTPPTLAPPPSPGQWGHLEEIQLLNDGSGLGFGIVGGRSSGVVVRTLVPNSVADRDGRLRTGDHILRIGATPTSGLTSDQVVKVLQGCGSHVTMLIARDPRGQRSAAPPPPPPPDSAPIASVEPRPTEGSLQRRASATPNLEGYEIHQVPLRKGGGQSLGISIIGFNPLTSQDAVGVFVKHVVPGSAADHSGNVRVQDRLIALDGVSLQGLTNQEVMEVMKQTGQTVVLTLVRKKARGLERSLDKVERQSSGAVGGAVEVRGHRSASSSMSRKQDGALPATSWLSRGLEADLRAKWEQALGPQYQVLVVQLDPVIEDDAELQRSSKLLPIHTLRLGLELDSFDGHHYVSSVAPGGPAHQQGALRPEDELLEVNNVQLYGKSRREAVSFLKEVPPPFTLVCCRLLASELEPEPEPLLDPDPGPVGSSERSVEEMELKLSAIICSQEERRKPVPAEEEEVEEEEVEMEEEEEEVDEEVEVGEHPSNPEEEEEEEEEGELALWSPDVQLVQLQKEGGRGLGFSILDYQDPMDPARCVMVIRSLVPGGSAEQHGGLLPGDQLVLVNETQLDRLTLAQAVEVLKSAPPGAVLLGIRKPLVEALGPGTHGAAQVPPSTSPDPQTLSDGSTLPEGLHQEQEEEELEEEEKELILDGGLPRYVSSLTSDREMAVDEEEVEMEMEMQERAEERPGSLTRKAPPSWEEWRLSSVKPSGGGEPVWGEEEDSWDRDSLASVGKLILGLPESRDSEADSELTLTDTDTEAVRAVDTARRKRRSHGSFLPTRAVSRDLPEREEGEGEETPAFSHWAPPRRVEVWPEEGQSLGLSIVGGRHVIKRLKNGEELKGIFIKQVLPNSPAAKTRSLKTGDKILEVSGVDLRAASHEEAVGAIKSAPSPIVFVVQSLLATPRPMSLTASSFRPKAKRTASPGRGAVSPAGGSTSSAQSGFQQKPAVAPPPLKQPPPYRPPVQSEQELVSDLDQVRGLV